MKLTTLLFLFVSFLIPFSASAQLPDGSEAPDWTLTDINNVEHNLYTLLDQGKMVVIEFSATWCGPCWNYMQTGALEQFWDEHGPNGDDTAQAFYIEADQSTGMDDLLGLTPSSQGNWVAAIPFPLIDLQVGENTDNDYNIGYYPTLFAVCSDKKLYELGQVGADEWSEFIESCMLAGSVESIEQAVCYGDGAVELDVTGGVSPIDYDWSDGSSQPSLQNVGAGVYSVTVTEANGKSFILEDIVIEGSDTPLELASADIDPALCFESATGAVSIEIDGAIEPVEYDWSNGDQTQNIENLVAGQYDVVATDANGCLFEDSFVVTEPEELVASYETTPEYCDQGDGSILLDIDGGVGNYSVYASEGDVQDNLIYNLYAGNITATIEDGNGCIWEENVDIEFVAQHELFFTPDPEINCISPSTIVEGFITGGFDDYEYEWSTVNGHIVGETDGSSIEVDQEGDYDLAVYDIFSGCTAVSSVYVTSTADLPEVSAGADAPITCEITEAILQGTGDSENVISWTTTDGHIVSGGDTYTPTVDEPGTYVIEVLNPNNACANVDTVIVLDQIAPADAQFQYQTSGLTIATTDISTGSNLSGWAWTFGDGNSSNDQNPQYTYAAEGNYEVCLSVQNGCGESNICQTLNVMIDGSTISVLETVQDVLCHSGSTGSITLIVNGGSGNYTFSWTGPDGQTYATQSINDLPAGIYQLEITDDMGNTFTTEYTVNEPTPLVLIGSTVTDNLCFGDLNGVVSVDIAGGVGPYLYSFNQGPNQMENTIGSLPAGIVEGIITDANGCQFSAGPYSIQEPLQVENITTVKSVSCFGDTDGSAVIQTQGGVAPYSYLWNIGGVILPEIGDLAPGTYTCAITDHNGCESEVSIDVIEPGILDVASVLAVDATGIEQNNGSISIEITGGTAPYSISWSNGATGSSIEGLVPGEYTYSVIDANGCSLGTSNPILINGVVATTIVPWAEFITVTPNPSTGDVKVTWEGLTSDQGTITLTTMQGKRLQVERVNSSAGTWDLSQYNLASGVYIILFEMNKEAVPYKLIVL